MLRRKVRRSAWKRGMRILRCGNGVCRQADRVFCMRFRQVPGSRRDAPQRQLPNMRQRSICCGQQHRVQRMRHRQIPRVEYFCCAFVQVLCSRNRVCGHADCLQCLHTWQVSISKHVGKCPVLELCCWPVRCERNTSMWGMRDGKVPGAERGACVHLQVLSGWESFCRHSKRMF